MLSLHEGRTVTLEWPDVSAVAAYVPNSGQDLKRLDHRIGTWEPQMRAHLKAVGVCAKYCASFRWACRLGEKKGAIEGSARDRAALRGQEGERIVELYDGAGPTIQHRAGDCAMRVFD